MSATYDLFCRWKASKGFRSVNQAALALGLPRQTVQNWKEGRNGEPEYIERMAQDLGEDPVKTILAAYAEQKTGKSAKVLEKLSKRFAAIACLALLLGVAAAYPEASEASDTIHYAKLIGSAVVMFGLIMLGRYLWSKTQYGHEGTN